MGISNNRRIKFSRSFFLIGRKFIQFIYTQSIPLYLYFKIIYIRQFFKLPCSFINTTISSILQTISRRKSMSRSQAFCSQIFNMKIQLICTCKIIKKITLFFFQNISSPITNKRYCIFFCQNSFFKIIIILNKLKFSRSSIYIFMFLFH